MIQMRHGRQVVAPPRQAADLHHAAQPPRSLPRRACAGGRRRVPRRPARAAGDAPRRRQLRGRRRQRRGAGGASRPRRDRRGRRERRRRLLARLRARRGERRRPGGQPALPGRAAGVVARQGRAAARRHDRRVRLAVPEGGPRQRRGRLLEGHGGRVAPATARALPQLRDRSGSPRVAARASPADAAQRQRARGRRIGADRRRGGPDRPALRGGHPRRDHLGRGGCGSGAALPARRARIDARLPGRDGARGAPRDRHLQGADGGLLPLPATVHLGAAALGPRSGITARG